IIMTHGDDNGLVLPPRIAPTQVIVIPIAQHKPGVLEMAEELNGILKAAGLKVKVDDTDKSPGWKFSEQEMRGIPVRVEIGPKDMEQNQAVIVRRDTREKKIVSLDTLAESVKEMLDAMQHEMFERAQERLYSNIRDAKTYDEFKDLIANKPGFVRTMWCGDQACEMKIKEDTSATSRCMPFEQEQISDVCVCCGKPAKKLIYWGKAY
ncbi:MAG: proline--tRNA ligase, partial [Oscillospiraceae bacterium]|nr:proline--tRNA ligase [Oscillospiraceae bacterium]